MLIKLAKARVERNNISPGEEEILRQVVKMANPTAATIANQLGKTRQYVSRLLIKLAEAKLISFKKHGANKYVTPILDAVIAYGVDE